MLLSVVLTRLLIFVGKCPSSSVVESPGPPPWVARGSILFLPCGSITLEQRR